MKNKLLLLIILFVSIYAVPVFASNSIDYQLTITDDFKFQEVITYRIEDYKSHSNGYNYMNDIIDDDVYADILGNTKYTKKVTKKSGIYYVTLTKTFSEYTMSNSAFLNNCFQKPTYKYDMNKYSFSGKGGFNCLDANNMKLTIITNFTVNSSNATVTDNKYVWTPTDANFSMNIDITKQYKDAVVDPDEPYDDIEDESSTDNTDTTTDDIDNEQENEKKNSIAIYVLVGILFVTALGIVFIVPVLKRKNSSLNEI